MTKRRCTVDFDAPKHGGEMDRVGGSVGADRAAATARGAPASAPWPEAAAGPAGARRLRDWNEAGVWQQLHGPDTRDTNPIHFFADRGYDHDIYRHQVRQRRIVPAIARRDTLHGTGLGTYRWVIERRGLLHVQVTGCSQAASATVVFMMVSKSMGANRRK